MSTPPAEQPSAEALALERNKKRALIEQNKNRAIIPALEAVADEVERRKADGTLAKQLKGLNVGALLGNLTRMVSAIKEASVNVVIPGHGGPAGPDATWLRANSTKDMTDRERDLRRRAVINAEVVKEKDA